MKNYNGRTGFKLWLYMNEDWWLPLVLVLIPPCSFVGMLWWVLQ